MRRARTFAIAGLSLALTACAKSIRELPRTQIPAPAPDAVESVLFLIGDAGYANENRNPILHVLRSDVEHWSGALARDSAVMVLFLGDIIYPEGLRPAGDPAFATDSLHAQSQVNIVAGPSATKYRSIGYFMAGNHDWGSALNHTGVRRLRNLEEFLDRRRAGGVHVRLQPVAGAPGPAVIDFGSTRLLMFDTAWWLLARDEAWKQRSYNQTQRAINTAGGRNIIVAAHHPFFSSSSHGGLVPFWRALGIPFLLSRSGAFLQDLNSMAYRDLLAMLSTAFEAGRPLLFAGGHDHTLQIIASDEPGTPRFTAVVGSASKSSPVGDFKGMTFRDSAPGYMRLITYRDGRVILFVISAPDNTYLSCAQADSTGLQNCMRERSAEFHIAHAQRLK